MDYKSNYQKEEGTDKKEGSVRKFQDSSSENEDHGDIEVEDFNDQQSEKIMEEESDEEGNVYYNEIAEEDEDVGNSPINLPQGEFFTDDENEEDEEDLATEKIY